MTSDSITAAIMAFLCGLSGLAVMKASFALPFTASQACAGNYPLESVAHAQRDKVLVVVAADAGERRIRRIADQFRPTADADQ